MKTKGFTLVELLVVIAILAILATVSVVGYTSFIDRANMSNAQTEADQIKSIVENALLADDYVQLVDGESGIYAEKVSGTITFKTGVAPTTAGKTTFDATDDISELVVSGVSTLVADVTNNVLTYTNYGYEVNVMTRAAEKAE